MNKKKGNHSGFTLVELLIAIAMLTIMVVPLTMNFVSASKVNGKAKSTLYATEMAQNMFEGISATYPEDSIMRLSAADPGFPVQFLPTDFVYSKMGECSVKLKENVVTKKKEPELDVNGEFSFTNYTEVRNTYIESVEPNADGSTFRYSGFKETADGSMTYSFWMTGVKHKDDNKNGYDVRLTFVGSNSNKVELDMQKESKISGINPSYDCVFMEGASVFRNVMTTEYRYKRLTVNQPEKDLLPHIKREYVVNITKENPSLPDSEVVVDVSTEYEYDGSVAAGYGPEYCPPTERIFSSQISGQNPRNIFIYYTPNYSSTSTRELDSFVINNRYDLDVNVYIVRMSQAAQSGDVFEGVNDTTEVKEQNYAASVLIDETDINTVNTQIRTNLSSNLWYLSDSNMNNDNTKRNPDHIKYRVGGLTPYIVASEAADLSGISGPILMVKTLDGQTEESRTYDVTIEIFNGGAYTGGFDVKDRVAKFTGSIVQ